jgi:tetratricopeptide (TPR) repeat protein
MKKGKKLIKKGQFEEALIYFHHLCEKKPDDEMIYVDIGDVYQRMGDPNKKIEFYIETIRKNPRFSVIKALLIEHYMNAENYDNVIQLFKKSVDNNVPLPRSTVRWIFHHFMEKKMYDKANEVYNYAKEKGISYKLTWDEVFMKFFEKEQYQVCEYMYNVVLKNNPEDPHPHLTLIGVYYHWEKYENALKIAEQLKDIDLKNAWEQIAIIYCKMGKYKEALNACNEILKNEPDLDSLNDIREKILFKMKKNKF